MSKSPKFSIVLPYLRAEKTIARAVESVLQQGFADFELITVGDGSSDGSAEILAEYARQDGRIRNMAYEENRGPSFARNRGFEAAAGEWIALLDADDAYAPSRLADLVASVRSSPILVDNLMGLDPYDGCEAGVMFPDLPSTLTVADIASPSVAGSVFDYGYLKPTFLRAFVERHRLRYEENLRTAEDLVLLIEACLKAGAIDVCGRASYLYTLQISAKYPLRKGTTHTVPRGREVAAALQRLSDRLGPELGADARQKLQSRIDRLSDTADVNEFRHHLLYGSLATAVSGFCRSAKARRYVASLVKRKLARRLDALARGSSGRP